jgi:Holliday junction DNA helicase RuvB
MGQAVIAWPFYLEEATMSVRQWHWRPSTLDEYIGQQSLVRWLRQEIKASQIQNRAMGNMLFYGAPGTGKTTLVSLVAAARGVNVLPMMGPNVTETMLADVLGAGQSSNPDKVVSDIGWHMDRNFKGGDIRRFARTGEPLQPTILCIDEIDGMPAKLFEMLHMVMEPDGNGQRWYIHKPAGGRTPRQYWVPDLTVVGITNYEHAIPPAFKRGGRIRKAHEFELYSETELAQILKQFSQATGRSVTPEAAHTLALRANGSPAKVRDYFVDACSLVDIDHAENKHLGQQVTAKHVEVALDVLEVDKLGLEKPHRDYLRRLADSSTGKMALSSMAATLNKDQRTISVSVEPLLLRLGLIEVIPGGRQITSRGRDHIGLNHAFATGLRFARSI